MYGIHTAFSGRLGSDPEPKYTSSGKLLLTFRVAVDEPPGDGAARGDTTWVKTTVWEEKAEALQADLLKGMAVYCEGRLKLETWTGKDGQTRSGLACTAWRVERLGQIGKHAPRRDADAAQGREDPVALAPAPSGSWLDT